jgi:serine O-acetyltransferase
MEKNDKHTRHLNHENFTPDEIDSGLFETIVKKLCEKNDNATRFIQNEMQCHSLPSLDVIVGIIEDLRSILFPGYFGNSALSTGTLHFYIGSTLDRVFRTMKEQIKRGLCFVCEGKLDLARCTEYDEQALTITKSFLSRLPFVREVLVTDVKAHYESDPAATNTYETIFCYPGVYAITNYRLAHELYVFGVPLIPRIITEHAHSITGVDIHPGAVIGESFFIDHGTGVVIGETCIIGKNVKIYQGVTLGAKSFPLDDQGKPIKGINRHPIVEDDVIIYSGATILGRVTIGKGSVIGGNVWLTHSVAPGSRITQMEAREGIFRDGAGI